jgi:radical SAM protein with 4Fe4S-binding SPASM domain
MSDCAYGKISNFEFSRTEIDQAVRDGKLLSMEIEFSLNCNFSCPYCYVPDKSSTENELTVDEICDVVLQARELGVKKMIVLGGEPMIYPRIMDLLRFMRELELEVEIFTNGTNITPKIASQLLDYGVNVVLKMNSFDEDVQDRLTGIDGSSKIIHTALNNLKQAGYPSNGAFLAVSTIICRQNIDELVDLWIWLRDQEIIPYFEIVTPQSKATQNTWLNVGPEEIRDVFHKIAEIDRTQYGFEWDPQPPLVGGRCLRNQFSCLVNSYGYVMPCVGVTIPVGNIRERKLKDILDESEVLQDLRNFSKNIKGPCRTCEKASECYGCRGAAYQLTGDYLASDPLCWKNLSKQEQIVHLPMPVDTIIPQQSSMRVIDTLDSIGERKADATVVVREDMPFIEEDGTLDQAVYIEMIAQSVASMKGFRQMGGSTAAPEGMLLGVKKFKISGAARVGDKLKISGHQFGRYGDFYLVHGTVKRDGEIIAEGEIKIWHNSAKARQKRPMAMKPRREKVLA